MDEVEALGFRILTDRDFNQLRIVQCFEEDYGDYMAERIENREIED